MKNLKSALAKAFLNPEYPLYLNSELSQTGPQSLPETRNSIPEHTGAQKQHPGASWSPQNGIPGPHGAQKQPPRASRSQGFPEPRNSPPERRNSVLTPTYLTRALDSTRIGPGFGQESTRILQSELIFSAGLKSLGGMNSFHNSAQLTIQLT